MYNCINKLICIHHEVMSHNFDRKLDSAAENKESVDAAAPVVSVKSREDRVRDALSLNPSLNKEDVSGKLLRDEKTAVAEYGRNTQGSIGEDVLTTKYNFAYNEIKPQLVFSAKKMVTAIDNLLSKVASEEKSFFGAKAKAVKALEEGLVSLQAVSEQMMQEEGLSIEKLRARYDRITNDAQEKLNDAIAKDGRLSAEGQSEARAKGQDSFSHLSPVDTADGAQQGYDVRDPAIVVRSARIEAGFDQAIARLQQAAEKLGVSIE